MKEVVPMETLDADGIIQLLEAPAEDRRPTVRRIEAHVPVSELIEALQKSQTPLVRQILCDILGRRHEKAAVPALTVALRDQSIGVRASAADALAKIGSIRAGPALLRQFTDVGEVVQVKHMLALALGAVSYKPAVPSLVQALEDSNGTLRGCAAWSLRALKATEAEEPLRRALTSETNAYAIERLREALAQFQQHPKAKKRADKKKAKQRRKLTVGRRARKG